MSRIIQKDLEWLVTTMIESSDIHYSDQLDVRYKMIVVNEIMYICLLLPPSNKVWYLSALGVFQKLANNMAVCVDNSKIKRYYPVTDEQMEEDGVTPPPKGQWLIMRVDFSE